MLVKEPVSRCCPQLLKCNPSALFCAIPGTSAPSPASKRPYRPWPTSTGPPVNAHGIHHQPNIKLEVNWNSPRRIPLLLQRYIKCTIRTTPPFSSVIKGPTVTHPPLGVIKLLEANTTLKTATGREHLLRDVQSQLQTAHTEGSRLKEGNFSVYVLTVVR